MGRNQFMSVVIVGVFRTDKLTNLLTTVGREEIAVVLVVVVVEKQVVKKDNNGCWE